MTRFILFALLTSSFIFGQEKTNLKALQVIYQKEQLRSQKLEESKKKILSRKYDENAHSSKYFLGMENNIPIYIESHDAGQAETINVKQIHNSGNAALKASGEGISIYVWDEGSVYENHQELIGRITNKDTATYNIHSTGVAGVIAAGGIVPKSIGMAYESKLISYDFMENMGEIATESGNNLDFMLSNHSYGYQAGWRKSGGEWLWHGYPHINKDESPLHGYYSANDKSFDNILYKAPFHTLVKSAGNDRGIGPANGTTHKALNIIGDWQEFTTDRPKNCGKTGYDCIPYGSMAKNLIVVGSVENISGGYTKPGDVIPASSTSFGPTDDGRIKPDIVAPGVNINSTYYDKNNHQSNYGIFNGTSFSAPAVTGAIALLQEINHRKNASYLRSDQLKALIIATANEAGGNPGPDYKFGWGLLNTVEAAEAILQNEVSSLVESKTLNNAITDEIKVVAQGNGQALNVTIAWLDPAANVNTNFTLNNRTPKLINDLDIRVFDSSNREYFPWVLDVEKPANAATEADNKADNVEQIIIDKPIAGEVYTIKVSHKGSLINNSQVYALVALGGRGKGLGVIDPSDKKKISIYPNPVKDILKLHSKTALTNAKIQIVNISGQVVFEERATKINSEKTLNISKLSSGVYILILTSDQEKITQKIIKK